MKRLLGVAVVALVLAGGLAGCGARARLAGRAAQPAATVPATSSATTPTTGAPTTHATTTHAASPDAQIASVQQTLAGLDATLTSINTNITQADKAADSDSQ